MGLDMYLQGEKFFWRCFNDRSKERVEDGFKVQSVILELGYWRKHPDLHGYIVRAFAEGRDVCQKINLSADAIRQIIKAVRAQELPHTTGFFFGNSDGSEADGDVAIFERALRWLESSDKPPVTTEPSDLPLPAGLSVLAVKIAPDVDDNVQQVTRSVYYRASW